MSSRLSSSPESESKPPQHPVHVTLPASFFPEVAEAAEVKHKTIPDWVRELVRAELFDHPDFTKPIRLVVSKDLYDQLAMVAKDDTRDVENMVLHLIRTTCAAAIAKKAARN